METNKNKANENKVDKLPENQISIENEINGNMEGVKPVEKKKQKVSASYTLRSLGDNIKKLEELELIDSEQASQLKGIQINAFGKFMGV